MILEMMDRGGGPMTLPDSQYSAALKSASHLGLIEQVGRAPSPNGTTPLMLWRLTKVGREVALGRATVAAVGPVVDGKRRRMGVVATWLSSLPAGIRIEPRRCDCSRLAANEGTMNDKPIARLG